MKILKGLLLISIASLVCIPLCFSSSFEKPSGVQNGSIRPAHLDSNGNSAISGECVIINASDNTAFDYVSCAGLETDPVFVASPSNGITAGHIANWNIAYAYGNWQSQGFITSVNQSASYNWTGAVNNFFSNIQLPWGANPTVNTNGSIAIDTTANQVIFYGNTTYVLSSEKSGSITIPDLVSTDDNFLVWVAPTNITVVKVGCKYVGTGNVAATIALLDDSNNAMTHGAVACTNSGTVVTYVDVTANNQLLQGEGLAMNVTNTPDPLTDDYTISWSYQIDRE